ncbi:hypothetical protein [Halorarum salinum]|uniref:Uncharacterized protein n=1 Tax=Halorarum salinum TaxID=2743089 RepID=A0A7D5QGG0_9EURY|nr:hypothetical protein [Halobaculum salinum]QLG62022.1 hypothetical protein HUG12_09915 [Halobaculum salinum]
MPANRPYRTQRHGENVVEFRVNGDLEDKRTVYFTDQEPCFQITVENIGDRPVEGKTIARMTYEESSSAYERGEHKTLDIDLAPGEKETLDFQLEMLSYQGSAAVAFDRIRLRDKNDYWEMKKNSGPSLFRAYTFMVYDRDYYKVNYLRPRIAQYVAAGLAILIVAVGVIQILIFLFS